MKDGWTRKDKQDGCRPCRAESYRPVVYPLPMPLQRQRNQRIPELPTGNTLESPWGRLWRQLSRSGGRRHDNDPPCFAVGKQISQQDRDMIIRDATEADVPEIQSIYAHHVLTGTGTFEEEPPSVEDMLARYRRIIDHGWRWLVAADEAGVLGYGDYSQVREWAGYSACMGDSV